MRTRLSVSDSISSSLLLAVFAWAFLSLPIFDSYGLSNYIIIHSQYGWFVIAQRLIHFLICFSIIYFFNRDRVVFWYDDENLYIEDKVNSDEQVILLKDITSLEMKPVLLKAGARKYKYDINYLNTEKQTDVISVMVRPGKSFAGFLKVLKVANPNVASKDYTYN